MNKIIETPIADVILSDTECLVRTYEQSNSYGPTFRKEISKADSCSEVVNTLRQIAKKNWHSTDFSGMQKIIAKELSKDGFEKVNYKKKQESFAASFVDIDLAGKKNSIPDWMERISQVTRSEQNAIQEWTAILNSTGLPAGLRSVIEEIINEEKDHLVLSSSMVAAEIQRAFPKNTDELDTLGTDAVTPGEIKKESEGVTEAYGDLSENEQSIIDRNGITLTQISFDDLSGTSTYEIKSKVQYDEDFLLKSKTQIDNSIQNFNSYNDGITIDLVSFGAGQITLKVKADVENSDDVEYFEGLSIIRIILNYTSGEGAVWLNT